MKDYRQIDQAIEKRIVNAAKNIPITNAQAGWLKLKSELDHYDALKKESSSKFRFLSIFVVLLFVSSEKNAGMTCFTHESNNIFLHVDENQKLEKKNSIHTENQDDRKLKKKNLVIHKEERILNKTSNKNEVDSSNIEKMIEPAEKTDSLFLFW